MKILIVDDEEGIRSQIRWALADEYEVLEAADARTAIQIIKDERPDLVTIDIALIFRELKEYDVTELLDRVGRDAHGADIPFDTNPFVSFGVLEVFGIFHLFLISTPADE